MATLTDWVIGLIAGRDLGEQHIRWCIKKENDHIRSLNSTKPIPTTLHAAMYQDSSLNDAHMSQSSRSFTASYKMYSAHCSEAGPQILMPAQSFLDVHSHYAKVPNQVSIYTEALEVAQSYKFGTIKTIQRTTFDLNRENQILKAPLRRPKQKINDLENLKPLNSALCKEMTQRNQVIEQAARFAELRKAQEVAYERRRRNSTKQQHPLPPFILKVDRRLPGVHDSEHLVDTLPPYFTPPASPEHMHETDQQDLQAVSVAADNPTRLPQIRWAANLLQQKQRKAHGALAQHQKRPGSVPHHPRRESSHRHSNFRKTSALTADE
ncbi:hypothetical protein ACLMJK_004185 [Lecanora helva]